MSAAVCFVIMSLASGLLYVSELIEEHAKVAKYYGQRGIYAIIVLHVILCISDSLPVTLTMFSIICHFLYLQNFSHTWPLISLTSPVFLCSCALVVVDHFVWFFHFSRMTTQYHEQARRYGASRNAPYLGFKEIATFFGICVWLAPLFLFLSLSANDNALPTSTSSVDATAAPSSGGQTVTRKNRVSLFRSVFSSLPLLRKRDDVIIAPPSPILNPRISHHPLPASYPRPLG
ncbi:DUF396-domain-containing protein [Hymenopellis radicata]|nr:DUF396-domain-containing protein [Hymenopellis radicata]